jgi:hypothetical protein
MGDAGMRGVSVLAQLGVHSPARLLELPKTADQPQIVAGREQLGRPSSGFRLSSRLTWGHLTKRTIKHANEATCQVELLEVERSPVRKLEIDPILTRFWRPPDVRLEYTPV